MKLPDIQHRRVATPQSQSPMAAVSKYRDKQKILQGAQELVSEYAGVVSDREKYDARVGHIEDLTQFEIDNGQRVSYTAEEVAELNLQQDFGDRDVIPAHEVRPFHLEKVLSESIQERGESIRGSKARQEWTQVSEQVATEAVRRSVQTANKQTARYNIERGAQAIKQAQESGLFSESSKLIETLPVSEEQKVYMREVNNQASGLFDAQYLAQSDDYNAIEKGLERIESGDTTLNPANAAKASKMLEAGYTEARGEAVSAEGDLYYEAIRGGDPEDIQRGIEYLRSDTYGGVLEEKERYIWAGRLGGEYKSLTDRSTAYERAQEAIAVDDVQAVTGYLETGTVVDPTSLIMTEERVDALRGSTNQSTLTAIAKYDRAMGSYGELVQFQRSSLPDQQDTIDSLNDDRTPEGLDKRAVLAKAYTENRKLLETDTMAYLTKQGVDVPDLPDIESHDFSAVLSQRSQLDREAFETNGVSSGPLSIDEVDAVGDWLLKGDPQMLAAKVNAGMGREAPLFWDQVLKSGTGVQAVAGAIPARDGDKVLAGIDLRQDYAPAELKGYRSQAFELMGDAYGTSRSERRLRADAAVNHLIATLDQGMEGSIESSVDAVTGGLVEFNNSTFESPEPGVTSDQVDAWVDGLGSDDLPIIRQGTRDSVLLQLQSGGINLVPAGSKQYYMQRVDTGMFLTTGGDIKTRAVLRWPGVGAIEYKKPARPPGRPRG